MDERLRAAWATTVAVVRAVRQRDVPFMAGSIAYNAFVSLLPLILLLTLLASLFAGGELRFKIAHLAATYLSPGAGQLIGNAIEDADAGGTGVSIAGFAALIWGTFKVFRGLDTAFSEIYGTDGDDSLPEQFRDGAVVLSVLAVSVTAVATAGTAFALFEYVPFIGLLNPLALVVGLTVAFVPMYYVFPDVDVTIRDVLPGVVVAAVGWALLQGLFQVYVSLSGTADAYGFLGGILLLITWLYFGGLVVLVGATVNAVRAGYAGGTAVTAADVDAKAPGSASRLDGEEAAAFLRDLAAVAGDGERSGQGSTGDAADDAPDTPDADGIACPASIDGLEVTDPPETPDDEAVREVRVRWRTAGEGDERG